MPQFRVPSPDGGVARQWPGHVGQQDVCQCRLFVGVLPGHSKGWAGLAGSRCWQRRCYQSLSLRAVTVSHIIPQGSSPNSGPVQCTSHCLTAKQQATGIQRARSTLMPGACSAKTQLAKSHRTTDQQQQAHRCCALRVGAHSTPELGETTAPAHQHSRALCCMPK